MNAALWLAVGASAGVLLGVAIADRGGSGTLLRRISSALRTFNVLKSQFARLSDRRASAGARAEDEDADGDYEAYEEAEFAEFDDDELEDEGSGFEPDTAHDRIDARVLAAFEQDPILSERDIEIDEPEPTVIALTGRVATMRDAKHAVTVARGVPGVERVENYLRIRHRAPVSPPPEEADV
jgi:osmotically-inducible protein OsmY